MNAGIKVTEGIYSNAIGFFKVERGQSGYLYAKKLVKGANGKPKWSYEDGKGAIFKLQPQTKITLDQAKQFGIATGVCIICGRTLTDQNSVKAGIGPICAKGF